MVTGAGRGFDEEQTRNHLMDGLGALSSLESSRRHHRQQSAPGGVVHTLTATSLMLLSSLQARGSLKENGMILNAGIDSAKGDARD